MFMYGGMLGKDVRFLRGIRSKNNFFLLRFLDLVPPVDKHESEGTHLLTKH